MKPSAGKYDSLIQTSTRATLYSVCFFGTLYCLSHLPEDSEKYACGATVLVFAFIYFYTRIVVRDFAASKKSRDSN